MGQRLNLEITKGGKVLANSYYHWDAYTRPAFKHTLIAHNFLSVHKDIIKDDKLLAIRALEETGAGLPEYADDTGDYTRIKNIKKYSNMMFEKCTSRNAGIIGCFPDSIKNTQDWAEGTAIINLDDMSILFDVFNYYESVKDIKEWNEDFDENDVVVFNYDPDEMSLGELKEVVDTVCSDKWVLLNGQYFCELG